MNKIYPMTHFESSGFVRQGKTLPFPRTNSKTSVPFLFRAKRPFPLVISILFILLSSAFTPSHSKVNKKFTISDLKKSFSLLGRRLAFSYEVHLPPKGRETKGSNHTVEGEFHFFSPGSFGLVLSFPPDRKGVRVLVAPKGGKMFNPKSGNTEELKSGFRTAALYGGPMTVDALDALVALSDPRTLWKEFPGQIEARHPLWGMVQFQQPGPSSMGSWLIPKRFKTRVEILSWETLGSSPFPVETRWLLLDKRDSGSAVLSLSDRGRTTLNPENFLKGK